MNNYQLDTDIIIDFLNNKDSLFSQILEKNIFISVITWSELIYGIKKSSDFDLKIKKLKSFIHDFNIGIIPIDQEIGTNYAENRINLEKSGNKLADFDILIATTALINNLILVTRNRSHFTRIPSLKLYK